MSTRGTGTGGTPGVSSLPTTAEQMGQSVSLSAPMCRCVAATDTRTAKASAQRATIARRSGARLRCLNHVDIK